MKWSSEGLERLARDVYRSTIPIVEGQLMSQLQVGKYITDQVSAFTYALHGLRTVDPRRMN